VSLDFGKQKMNTMSGSKTVKITNANPVPMAFVASVTGDYAIASNTCPSSLAAKEICDIGDLHAYHDRFATRDADFHGYRGQESADREA